MLCQAYLSCLNCREVQVSSILLQSDAHIFFLLNKLALAGSLKKTVLQINGRNGREVFSSRHFNWTIIHLINCTQLNIHFTLLLYERVVWNSPQTSHMMLLAIYKISIWIPCNSSNSTMKTTYHWSTGKLALKCILSRSRKCLVYPWAVNLREFPCRPVFLLWRHLSLISLHSSVRWSLLVSHFPSTYCLSIALFAKPRSRAVSAIRSLTSISVVLVVIPLRYHENGGGGTIAGSISWFKVIEDPTLPVPLVQESYSSNVHGSKGWHASLSTNRGSIFQLPSNFFIKPVLPCLNFTCQ